MSSSLPKEQFFEKKIYTTGDSRLNSDPSLLSSVHSKDTANDSSSSEDSSISSTEESLSKTDNYSSGWNIKFHIGHLFVFWSAILGIMFSSYLFGLFKGRTQGLEHALRTQKDFSLRLPLLSEVSKSSQDLAKSRASLGPAVLNNLRAGHSNETQVSATNKDSTISSKELKSQSNKISGPVVNTNELSKGWYVQILAANSLREAKAVVKQLDEIGLSSVIQKANLKKIEYFRVLSGPFPNKKESIRKQNDIRKLDIPASAPFIREVK